MKIVSTLCYAALLVAVPAQSAPFDADFERAMEEYGRGKYWAAYTGFTEAAKAGHVRSQEAAGLMLLAGPALYGRELKQDRDRAMYWLRLAAQAGSPVALHIVCGAEARVGSIAAADVQDPAMSSEPQTSNRAETAHAGVRCSHAKLEGGAAAR